MAITRTVAVLGLGIAVPADTDPWSIHVLRKADVVFHGLGSPIETQWLLGLRPDAISILQHYSATDHRSKVYSRIADNILQAVQRGGLVALALYGHPTYASSITQYLLRKSPRGGVDVLVRPGVSSADWLFADVGFDPVLDGCLLLDVNRIHLIKGADLHELSLVILQIALYECALVPRPGFTPATHLLADALEGFYPRTHPLLLYEAAVHPVLPRRMEWIQLGGLRDRNDIQMSTTAFIPSNSWLNKNSVQQLAVMPHSEFSKIILS